MKKIGFIDNYLDEWHANNYPAILDKLAGDEMKVTYAYARMDAPNGLTTDEWCEKMGVQRLDSIEELVEKSDYIIVLSPDHPQYHEELCRIPLSSGKRVYVDKTFAPDTATAKRIFAVANEHNTPVFSSSALRFADEMMAQTVKPDEIDHMTVIANGDPDIYLIHMIEPMVRLMGAAATRLMFVGTELSPSWIVEFEGGRKVNLVQYREAHSWYFRIHKKNGEVIEIPECNRFFDSFLEQLVDYFRTGEVKVDQAETVTVIELRTKAREAMEKPYEWLSVEH
ncbi:MAG: Gfo/Idh/MocA family oxidoreductase [Acutalibacteraceae bacterium]